MHGTLTKSPLSRRHFILSGATAAMICPDWQ